MLLLATARVIWSRVRGQTNDSCDGIQQIWGNLTQRRDTGPLLPAGPGQSKRLIFFLYCEL